MAFTLIVTNTTLIIGQVANPVAMASLGWRYYIVFCVLDALFVGAVWVLFPETKGKSLEELAGLFERLEGRGGVVVGDGVGDVEKLKMGGGHEEVEEREGERKQAELSVSAK